MNALENAFAKSMMRKITEKMARAMIAVSMMSRPVLQRKLKTRPPYIRQQKSKPNCQHCTAPYKRDGDRCFYCGSYLIPPRPPVGPTAYFFR